MLNRKAQVALTLRVVGGLTTEEIAKAFLTPTATVQQRIVRAKKALTASKAVFEVPGREEFSRRLSAVLGVLYLVFNEGYAASSGDEWMRAELSAEALRLARILAELVPRESEVHGLVALMELTASRFGARTTSTGEPILLADQDRTRWDRLQISRGLAALERADAVGRGRGPYGLQAAIAECHARAATFEDTDWKKIVILYELWRNWRHRPWSTSIMRRRYPWHTVLALRSNSSTSLSLQVNWPTTTCFPAFGGSCSVSSADPRRLEPNSSKRLGWPGTSVSALCWSRKPMRCCRIGSHAIVSQG